MVVIAQHLYLSDNDESYGRKQFACSIKRHSAALMPHRIYVLLSAFNAPLCICFVTVICI